MHIASSALKADIIQYLSEAYLEIEQHKTPHSGGFNRL